MILRGIRVRLYPNAEQRKFFENCFGCARFIWNKMLSDKEEHYKKTGKTLKVTPAQYKKEFSFLREVDSLALANVQLNLERAFSDFFSGKTKYPNYKSKKKSKKRYTTNNQNGTVAIKGNSIRLPKAGYVKAKIHREIPEGAKIKSATISLTPSGKYYCSILLEMEGYEQSPRAAIEEDTILAIDYSSSRFFVSNNGECGDAPHWFRESEKKLRRLQRSLSRKTKGSSNYDKTRRKIAILHEKIAERRENYAHQLSRKTANSCDVVVIEDLDMHGIAQSLKLGKSTHDNGFGRFRTLLQYKLKEKGKYLIKVDRFYPSSQLCSECGYQNREVKDLSLRRWTCPNCGTEHDRDINAAVNLKKEGIRILQENNILIL